MRHQTSFTVHVTREAIDAFDMRCMLIGILAPECAGDTLEGVEKSVFSAEEFHHVERKAERARRERDLERK